MVFFAFLRGDDLEVTLVGATELARLSTQRINEAMEPSDIAEFEGKLVEAILL